MQLLTLCHHTGNADCNISLSTKAGETKMRDITVADKTFPSQMWHLNMYELSTSWCTGKNEYTLANFKLIHRNYQSTKTKSLV